MNWLTIALAGCLLITVGGAGYFIGHSAEATNCANEKAATATQNAQALAKAQNDARQSKESIEAKTRSIGDTDLDGEFTKFGWLRTN